MTEAQKTVSEELANLANSYRQCAQEQMKEYGSPYEVYYFMKESIAFETKARTFLRRYGDTM